MKHKNVDLNRISPREFADAVRLLNELAINGGFTYADDAQLALTIAVIDMPVMDKIVYSGVDPNIISTFTRVFNNFLPTILTMSQATLRQITVVEDELNKPNHTRRQRTALKNRLTGLQMKYNDQRIKYGQIVMANHAARGAFV